MENQKIASEVIDPIGDDHSSIVHPIPVESENVRSNRLADLELWRQKGLITRDQMSNIIDFIGEGRSAPQSGPRKARVAGLNIVNVAYYFGGFLVLLAFTLLLGTLWIDAGNGAQVVFAAIAIAVPALVGVALRWKGFTTPGNLLIFAATGIVPLLVYTIERASGFWPGEEDPGHYRDYFDDVLPAWVLMELVAILAAIAVAYMIRFPLVTLLIAFWSWYISMDLVRWITHDETRAWTVTDGRIISALIGVAMIAIGVVLQRRTDRDYSLWLYLFGHITFFAAFSALALGKQGLLGWVIYPTVFLGVVVLSVWLQRKVFLVFGALGTYLWASYLVFETFNSAIGVSIGFAIMGILIVLSGVLYRAKIEPWLQDRLAGHQALVQPNDLGGASGHA